MHIQFWRTLYVLTLGSGFPSRSSLSRCSLEQQRMNCLRIRSNYRSLRGYTSASPIAPSAPRIDLAPGRFSTAAEVDTASLALAITLLDAAAAWRSRHMATAGDRRTLLRTGELRWVGTESELSDDRIIPDAAYLGATRRMDAGASRPRHQSDRATCRHRRTRCRAVGARSLHQRFIPRCEVLSCSRHAGDRGEIGSGPAP